MPVSSLPVVCLIVQSTAIRKIIGDSRQPCLTPILTSKDSVSFPLWITWHAALSYNCWMRCIIVDGVQ
uniref:Uncharacterized protein n=1 Tax=Trichobilharzia regenti TaxID=157069 RepID=A0AA85JUH6_TRIRE|nr:unnamed protein product [Trichobilharzia regenti]